MTQHTPCATRLDGVGGYALTVDVEEWYHNCLVPAYVHPELRPALPQELDRLLPFLLDMLAEAGATATFFVLGEVAERLPRRMREIAAAGHEVASHGYLHLRACGRPLDAFRRDIRRSKTLLEDLLGEPVLGFRAPEWSLRRLSSPLVPLVAEAGFLYDSSLAPYSFSGRRSNPRFACRLEWPEGHLPGPDLLEFPPLTFGGPLRVPAGSWTGRLVRPSRLAAAAARHLAEGGLPVMVIHPWELSGGPTPGPLSGLARFIHETGRRDFAPRLRILLHSLPWRSLRTAASLAGTTGTVPAAAEAGMPRLSLVPHLADSPVRARLSSAVRRRRQQWR
ncbi:MAG TPA: polysaccharide deacetylase family protein [Thermoanaerobaculia bacterium]|nr:polysaccharide deacetylase family protein [Thermoanaerobaculia bacterium]